MTIVYGLVPSRLQCSIHNLCHSPNLLFLVLASDDLQTHRCTIVDFGIILVLFISKS